MYIDDVWSSRERGGGSLQVLDFYGQTVCKKKPSKHDVKSHARAYCKYRFSVQMYLCLESYTSDKWETMNSQLRMQVLDYSDDLSFPVITMNWHAVVLCACYPFSARSVDSFVFSWGVMLSLVSLF